MVDLDTLPAAEYDGLLITEWLENREYSPMLPFAADFEFTYAHDDPDAWPHVVLPDGMTEGQARTLMTSLEPNRLDGLTASLTTTLRYNPSQPRDERGRWTKGRWTNIAMTPQEMWANDVDVTINPLAHGNRTEMRERIADALVTAAGKTTKINLDEVLVSTTRAMPRSMLGGVLGQFEEYPSPRIILSDEAFEPDVTEMHKRDSKHWEEGLNFDVPTSKFNDGLVVSLTHEVGHAADYTLTPDQREEMFNRLADAMKVERPTINIEWWSSNHFPEVRSALSAYGASNSGETIAEAWCEYRLNDRPRPAAKAVGTYIEEVLK